MESDAPTPEQLARALVTLSRWAERHAVEREPALRRVLVEHFGEDPTAFPVLSETVADYDRPNLQLALDAWLSEGGREHQLIGFGGPIDMMDISLGSLLGEDGYGPELKPGPVRRTVVELDEGRSVACVTVGLYLVTDGDSRLAVQLGSHRGPWGDGAISLEVMGATADAAQAFLADVRSLMREHNVYRGKAIALGAAGEMPQEGATIRFLALPSVRREDIVLPDGVLDTVELHTVEFSRHGEALLAGLRHLRRGLLFHGPPGTGKTLTATYVATILEGRTVILLSGAGLGLIGPACTLARSLAPSLVVLEDVDLVAHERTMMGPTTLLFELLNQMDGIGEDADVVFVLTTNRADRLEPALAARPGRVDQAIEFPLPDGPARRRLIELFCTGLDVQLSNPESIVARTDDVSPAFLRELVRKAALHALRAGDEQISDRHFDAALTQLEQGGSLTRRLLGADPDDGLESLDDDGGAWFGAEVDD